MSEDIRTKLTEAKRRHCVDSKYAVHHIGHKRWDIISKNIGSDIELWRGLYEKGKIRSSNNGIQFNKKNITSLAENDTKTFICCGEEIYLSIRPDLISKEIIHNETPIKVKKINNKIKKKGKTAPINKAEKIKQENIIRKIKSDVDSLLKSITYEPYIAKQIVFTGKYIELVLVRMMVQCRNICLKFDSAMKHLTTKSASKYTPKKEIIEFSRIVDRYRNELTELVVGFNKIINEKQNCLSISKTCLSDLINWVAYAKQIINFTATDVIIKKPELIFKTIYDGMLEEKQADLYQSQKEILEFVTTNEKYLALVHTMLGSGKTSMILPLCGWLSVNRKDDTKLIFCCPNDVVLLEVAHMVYGMGIPFGIVIHDQKENKLEYKWSSFIDKHRPKNSAILYLCDIFVARKLLEERLGFLQEKQMYLMANKRDPTNYPLTEQRVPYVPDYILMGDELTKDADSQNGFMVDSSFSVTTEVFVDIMRIAPPKIILMSATLPTAEQLPEFYGAIVAANPEMIVRSFASSEAKIGCALISSTGELYAPHMGSQFVDDIKHVLSIIKTNPFVGRFYTFEILLEMVQQFQKLSLPVPDLAVMFDDPTKANQTNIQHFAYKLLEQLITIGSDEIVQQACTMKKSVGQGVGVDLNTIFTSDIHRFNKGCLIFSTDPVSTAYQVYQANFNSFLDQTTDRDIFQQVRLDNILLKYQKETDLFEKALKRIDEKSDNGIIKQNKEKNKKEKSKTESWQRTSQMLDNRPTWEFPSELQLCSLEHLAKAKCTMITSIGGMVGPEDLPDNTCVSVDILTMLASGIGIYSTSSESLDEEYLKTVIYLAKKGLVKTIFTDSSIAYGTNLAVSDIIIIDEPITVSGSIVPSIVDKHSIKTIFQMLGRAGRGGNLSYEARIYTTSNDNNLIDRIQSYIRGTLDEGCKDEIINIRRAFEILWS